jgi:AcrR family transcriptional regulator
MAGLRERKKQETRAALSWAALRLFVERGPAVTVDDIAAEAGVSPRTFNNYFASKYEAIVWRHVERAVRLASQLRGRPVDEPLWQAVIAAATALFEHAEPGGDPGRELPLPLAEWKAGVRMLVERPELRGEFVKAAAAAEGELAAAVADRTGTDAGRDMYPRLVATAVGAALQVATEQWLRADPPVELASLVEDALRQFAAGLPDPRSI